MATSDKCPRCECEGNRVGCEMCYYYGFKCPGNCACCAYYKEPAAQRQAKTSSGDKQGGPTPKASTSNGRGGPSRKQARVSHNNEQKEPTQKQNRTPLRPLILRNVKKAISDSQKKASSVFQTVAGNSAVGESSTNKVTPATGAASSSKVNPSQVKLLKKVMVDAETQTPTHSVTYEVNTSEIQQPETDEVEPDLPGSYNEYVRKEKEEMKRIWNNIFWPQYDKVPCEPQKPLHEEDQRRKPSIISKEKLDEGINELVGDRCLNCHCQNPRDYCDICRRTDYQCLGSCLCCLSFRAGQRVLIFVTRGIYTLADGSFYGGGNVNL